MGENWVQRISRKYRHQIQAGACEFSAPTLFSLNGAIEKHYVGHLELRSDSIVEGAELGILLTSKRARPALVVSNEVIGYMEGDSAFDLQEQLKASDCWPVLLRVRVVSCSCETASVIVSPVPQKPGGANGK